MKSNCIRTFVWGGSNTPSGRHIFIHNEVIGFVVRGSITVEGEGSIIRANPNDSFIIERGQYYVDSENWFDLKVVLFEVPLVMFSRGIYRIGSAIVAKRFGSIIVEKSSSSLNKFFDRLENKIENSKTDILHESFLLELMKIVFLSPSLLSSKVLWYRKLDKDFAKAVDYIYSNMGNGFELAELGTHCNVAIYHLNRLFNRAVGVAPQRWTTIQKMNYAKYLIYTTDSKISEIAGMVGYYDTSNFIQKYKKHHNKTPLTERKKEKNKEIQVN